MLRNDNVIIASLLFVLLAGGAIAQDETPVRQPSNPPKAEPTPQSDPTNPGLWNAERMMEDAVQTLVKRYNLNPEQEEFTRALLVARVRKFLVAHEADLRQLLKESIDMQIGRVPATPENYKKWSERAQPIYEAAKTAILEGNREWGEILDEQQKTIHRMDLDQMATSFQQVDQLMVKWSEGNFDPGDLRPQPPPGTTSEVSEAHLVSREPPMVAMKVEDAWDLFVRRMIEVYRFTDDQKNAAYAILQESRNRAKGYRESRKEEFTRLEARLLSLSRTSPRPPEYAETEQKIRELEKPIDDLFSEMRTRLEEIPNKDQRESVTEEDRKSLDRLADLRTYGTGRTVVEPSKPIVTKPSTRRATQRPADKSEEKQEPTTAPASP
jgi:hypothetical protein